MISKCPLSNNTKAYIERFECILNEMIDQMSSVSFTESISGNFIVQMIPHHKAAIEMSENALRFSICTELVPLLEAIILSQKKGIREMQQLLAKINC